MVVICEFEGCDKAANYGTKENRFKHCKEHKVKGDTRYKWNICNHQNCKKHALFGINTQLTCSEHKQPDYIDVKRKKCKTCNKIASFKGENDEWYCTEHSKDKVVEDKRSRKKCISENCDHVASFNDKGKPPLYCLDHKLANMVDSRCCKEEGCLKSASFGIKGGKREYCDTHKKENMIYTSRKKCHHKGCDGTATYGEKGTKTRLYCTEHGKLYDNIIFIRSSCDECEKPNIWGIAGQRATKCKMHKKDDMIKLIFKKCKQDGCNKTGNFINENGKYCKEHSPNNAKVKKQKCQSCDKDATRGPVFGSLIKCIDHAERNHVTKHKINPKCKGEKCNDKPVFGIRGTNIPEYCDTHKLDNMYNIIERTCAGCQLSYLIPEGINLCEFCLQGAKVIKEKEDRIKQLFDSKGIKYDSYNKVIDSNCSNKRPDFVIDYNTFFVVVEVDETQHSRYNQDCETTRMKQIHQSVGMDTLFIRFNPDSYIDNTNKVIKSYAKRENTLIKLLGSLRNIEKLDHYLTVVYLFYDGFDGKITMQKIEY
ncbi:hypothetical protein F-M6_0120 [Faustovirus]|nr:hypothetical protein F-M6_0120 [Faustovirus]